MFDLKTLALIVRIQNSMCTAELCTPVHPSTNSEKHLATCHPCVLQKNLEHVALIPSQTIDLIQFAVWNILWLFYLTTAQNPHHGSYSMPSNSFQELQLFPTPKFPKFVVVILEKENINFLVHINIYTHTHIFTYWTQRKGYECLHLFL